jgi:hypothetical protein
MGYAHAKSYHDWSSIKKQSVKETLFPKDESDVADEPFIIELKSKILNRVTIKPQDRDRYRQYAETQIDKQLESDPNEQLIYTLKIVDEFDLDLEKIFEMDFGEYFDLESYLSAVSKVSKNVPPQFVSAFKKEMLGYNNDTYGGFSLHWHTYTHKIGSMDKVQPSDVGDLSYLPLLPYTTFFTCDRGMKDSINRVIKAKSFPVDTKILTAPEFKDLIGVEKTGIT